MNITIANKTHVDNLASIISQANKPVAEAFGINRNNNPKHPSFCTAGWLHKEFDRGVTYFLFKQQTNSVGCVNYETPDGETAYLNRLAVLPDYQRHGIGEKLVQHFFEYARSQGIKQISIGTIASHLALKKWYLKLGFVEGETRQYPHLPFDVTFMTYPLTGES